jgi:hypothetical protein
MTSSKFVFGTSTGIPAFPHVAVQNGQILGGWTMAITRDEIVSILGPVDDELVAELMGTGASAEELREAWGWLHNDEALMGAGARCPGPKWAG